MKSGREKNANFCPTCPRVQNWCKCYCRTLSLQRPHTLTAFVRRKREVFKSSEEHRHQNHRVHNRVLGMWQCRTQHGPRRHGGVHIYAPDPAARPQPKRGLISGTHSSGLAALSTAPTGSCFGAQQPCWEALGFQQWWAQPRSTGEGHGAVLLCLSWRGHQTCTPQDISTTQWEAESSSKSSLTALL